MYDTHVHLGPFVTDYFYGLASTMDSIEQIYPHTIFDGVCLIPSDKMDNEAVYKAHKQTRLHTKFLPWATPENLQTIKPMEFDGIKVHSAYSKIPISDYRYSEIIDLAEDRDVPITVHSGDIEQTDYKHVITVAKNYKNVKFIIGHMGGKRYQKCWQCPIDIEPYKNIYVDTTMRFKWHWLEHCQDVIGSKRMLFGSDYPISHPAVGMRALELSKVNYLDVTYNTPKVVFNW